MTQLKTKSSSLTRSQPEILLLAHKTAPSGLFALLLGGEHPGQERFEPIRDRIMFFTGVHQRARNERMSKYGSFGAAGVDEINTLNIATWVFNDDQINCEERSFGCGAGSSEAFGSAWVQVSAEFGCCVGGCARQVAAGVKLVEAGWFLLEQIQGVNRG